jgi:hypothetical protein
MEEREKRTRTNDVKVGLVDDLWDRRVRIILRTMAEEGEEGRTSSPIISSITSSRETTPMAPPASPGVYERERRLVECFEIGNKRRHTLETRRICERPVKKGVSQPQEYEREKRRTLLEVVQDVEAGGVGARLGQDGEGKVAELPVRGKDVSAGRKKG